MKLTLALILIDVKVWVEHLNKEFVDKDEHHAAGFMCTAIERGGTTYMLDMDPLAFVTYQGKSLDRFNFNPNLSNNGKATGT